MKTLITRCVVGTAAIFALAGTMHVNATTVKKYTPKTCTTTIVVKGTVCLPRIGCIKIIEHKKVCG